MTSSALRTVLVIGSANVDVSVRATVMPKPGETLFADGADLGLGGKGANQAVSAACNAPTRLVARVGEDAFGRMIREGLSARGVDVGEILPVSGVTTGMAVIYVEAHGENRIALAAGANEHLLPADVDAVEPLLREAAVVVLQCEIPMETSYRAMELAAAAGCPVIWNPAPYRGLDLARLQGRVSYLVVNEVEASQMSGMDITGVSSQVPDAERCAAALNARDFACVVLTLGARGCVIADAASVRHLPAHAVRPVDTTGAGDAFVGCVAGSLAAGWSRDDAIARANLYAALTTTHRGAQPPPAVSHELEQLWGSR